MKPWERWTFNLITLVVAVTGFAYFWMKYLIASDDPFAIVNHPWQGAMLALHVLAAPGMLLMFGILLNSHIMKKLGASRVPNRRSGLVSFATFFLMSISGYLLQVVTGEQALRIMLGLHLASGAIFSLVYVGHLAISVRLARAQVARRMQPELV